MSESLVIALAGAGVTALSAVSGLVLGLRAASAEQRAARAATDAANKAGELAIARADQSTLAEQVSAQKETIGVLKKHLSQANARLIATGNAESVVLGLWAEDHGANPADRQGPGAVPDRPAAAQPGADDLIDPYKD